jgi:RNA polymerase sigma-70 factor (ECF subfamily)
MDRHPTGDFDPLFDAHYGEIYRYCLRRLGSADAEDATAEVFAVAWRRIGEVRTATSSRAWLYGVAHKIVSNQHRRVRRRDGLVRRIVSQPPLGQDSPDPLVLQALETLSRSDQELLRLSVWDGLDRTEIAQILGIKENAVDQRLHRARSRLRDKYERLAHPSATTQEVAS